VSGRDEQGVVEAEQLPRLFERERQLSALHDLLRETRGTAGHVVMLGGPSGCGKTALLQEVMWAARTRDATCLEVVCSRDEQLVPFSAARELLRNAALRDELASDVAELLANRAFAEIPLGHEEAPLPEVTVRVFDELSRIVLTFAEPTTLVIGIDDVHHADTLSVRFFRYLAMRARTAPALLVLGELSTSNWMYSYPRTEITRMPHADTVAVGPLSRTGVRGLRGAVRHASLLWAASGGNPLLVQALLGDFERMGPRPGPGFGQALVSCLDRMGPDTLRVAGAVAVLGVQASTKVIAQVLEIDLEQTALIVKAMRRTGVAVQSDAVGFRHPSIAEALIEYLPPAVKAHLHHSCARVLYECGSDVTTVAAHLGKSGRAEDPWAVQVLTSAADRAMLESRAETAIEFLDLALRSDTQGHERWQALANLVWARWQLDPEHASRHFDELVAAARLGKLAPQDLVELTRLLLWKGRLDEAVPLAVQIQRVAGQKEAPETHEIGLWLGCVYPSLAKARTLANRAAPDRKAGEWSTGRVMSDVARLSAALSEAPAQETLTHAEHILRRVRVTSPAASSAECALLSLLALIYADDIVRARTWCDKLFAEAAHASTPLWLAVTSAIRAEIALYRGEFRLAAELATAALSHLTLEGWGVAVGVPLGCLVLAQVRMGRQVEAATLLGHVVPDALFSSRYGLHYLIARGHHHLAAGEEHAALADFLTCRELMQSWGLETAAPAQWRLAAAEVWYAQGNRGQVRRLTRQQIVRLGPVGSRPRGAALRLLAAVEDPRRREPLLTESIELLEGSGDRFELARAIAELSRAHRASGSHARARIELLRAVRLAEACGAEPLHRELLIDCVDLGIAPSEVVPEKAEQFASLTKAEQRVAVLASRGHTNREIATKLFVTASTVEQHLTRVYRKLSIKRRKDLVAVLCLDLADIA
jgi:DNA-binding CsgD family transcriptional regulator